MKPPSTVSRLLAAATASRSSYFEATGWAELLVRVWRKN